ncbi:putative phosphatidylglycerol phosphatidylinositol transfer protein [Diaporthe ampelina]|uniref:Phosphatidylglycerol/phosphatidylinositol transfer protein n=1 Tax=Diaporthe ampelina TaxID=1214573 RepID=A0A0G2HXR7_9PEZI|nr:putative phosphatidylglycerol phosphatidylinositol transfer protein [Diaporthe ampelina]
MRTVSVPDGTDDDVRDPSIADGATWPGEKIPGQNSFNLCKGDRSYDALVVNQLDLNPNPPLRGHDLTVLAAGTVNRPIEQGALVEVKVKIIGSEVYHHKFDLCGEMEKLGQSCPMAPGIYYFNQSFPIPKEGIPHATLAVNALAKFPDGSPITCIDGELEMS